jgi:hypothetical protein
MWGNQATADYEPDWNTYANHTVAQVHLNKENLDSNDKMLHIS